MVFFKLFFSNVTGGEFGTVSRNWRCAARCMQMGRFEPEAARVRRFRSPCERLPRRCSRLYGNQYV